MNKTDKAILRRRRVRVKISGTSKRPRLSVKITNRNIVCQLIDDQMSQTLIYGTTVNNKDLTGKNMTEKARWVGADIAAKAQKVKIKEVVFDRGAKIYHGRVKVLADAAREKGLKF
ncbi:MAG: 50S ribosomal protein L18 [bacterium]|nr:50S ribosomal protein L18 [bacterium]